jgi:hypothetical protein
LAFQELHKKVVEEQDEYMKYLESVAHRYANDYSLINPEAVKFAEVVTFSASFLFRFGG